MNGKKLVGWLSRDGIAAVMNVKQTYTVTYTDGSGTPSQAWLNYHDGRSMNHKQTEM